MNTSSSNRIPVIAIDGPSGTGKGTLAKRLAHEMGFHWLESGALYRLVALIALRESVPLDDIARLTEIAASMNIEFKLHDLQTPSEILLSGENVDAAIRAEDVGNAASHLAKYPPVREALLVRQHTMRKTPGLVADGRDMGSVVFPDANVKLFLDASIGVRAQRRYQQLLDSGKNASLRAVTQEMAERDARDRERVVSPLKPADDALVIDTSEMSAETVYDHVMTLIKAHLN